MSVIRTNFNLKMEAGTFTLWSAEPVASNDPSSLNFIHSIGAVCIVFQVRARVGVSSEMAYSRIT
ncbi:unnamed protein product [Haemonchus placei]|uniref:Uncharacterized protein n=1 Tax=Haemonchus placei TaxID=6290 RepID=A0A0N4VVI5_HAEPC|nr:unnamed protein product [Haemonchus placei]